MLIYTVYSTWMKVFFKKEVFIIAWQRSVLSEGPHWPGYNPITSLELVGPPQRAEAPGRATISSGSMSCCLPGA